jgi:hypothetical protein
MESMTTPGAGRLRHAWVILGGTALALLTASGVRSAVGVLEAEFGWDGVAPSLVASISFLFNALGWSFIRRLADRSGQAAMVAFAATLRVLPLRERPAARRPPAMVMAAPASGV